MSAAPNLWHPEKAWRKHSGGECPIPGDTRVLLQFACGRTSLREYAAKDFVWLRRGFDFDITAYKVTSAEDLQ